MGGAQELRATPSNSELLSAIRIGRTKLPGNRRKLGTPSFELRATPSYSELLQATPSHSERLLEFSELSERLLRATRAFRARKKLRRPPSYSELGAPKNSELLRATQRAAPNTFGKLSPRGQPDRIFSNSELGARTPSYQPASLEPAVFGIASSSEPLLECCLLARESTIKKLQSEEF